MRIDLQKKIARVQLNRDRGREAMEQVVSGADLREFHTLMCDKIRELSTDTSLGTPRQPKGFGLTADYRGGRLYYFQQIYPKRICVIVGIKILESTCQH